MLLWKPFFSGLAALLPFLGFVDAALPPPCDVCGEGKTRCNPSGSVLPLNPSNTTTSKDKIEQTVWKYDESQSEEIIKIVKLHKIGAAYSAISVVKARVTSVLILGIAFDRSPLEKLRIVGDCMRTYKDKVVTAVQLEVE